MFPGGWDSDRAADKKAPDTNRQASGGISSREVGTTTKLPTANQRKHQDTPTEALFVGGWDSDPKPQAPRKTT